MIYHPLKRGCHPTYLPYAVFTFMALPENEQEALLKQLKGDGPSIEQ